MIRSILLQYGNEYEEAEAVTDGISYAVQTGEADYKDFAILYRTKLSLVYWRKNW